MSTGSRIAERSELIQLQSIHGSTFARLSIWFRMGSTAFGTGSTTVCTPHPTHAPRSFSTLCVFDELTLIRPDYRNMASSRACHRWYPLSWLDGNKRRHLPRPPVPYSTGRYSKHLRSPRAGLLRPHCVGHIPPDLRNGHLSVRWSLGRCVHGYHPWLHLTFSRWKLRQRSHSHLLACIHLLLVDQGC